MVSESAKMLLIASHIKGLGRVKLLELLKFIKNESVQSNEFYSALKHIFKSKKNIDLSDDSFNKAQACAIEIIEKSENLGIKVLCSDDDYFPPLLKDSIFNPVILYAKGNIEKIPSRCISVIGTREPTEYGKQFAQEISEFLASKEISVVSGLALGCDTYAHEGALNANGHTIAVLAHGLDMVAPSQNLALANRIIENGGLLVSTYPIGTKPEPYNFAQRDCIQAGLSERVVLVQSGLQGGSLIASASILEDNRKLVVVSPHDVDIKKQEDKIQANLAIIEAKKQSTPNQLDFIKINSNKAKNVLSNIVVLNNNDYNSVFNIGFENTIENKPITPLVIKKDPYLETIEVPGFEVYTQKKLNGSSVDYILLSKDKGIVFININKDRKTNSDKDKNSKQHEKKIDDLVFAIDNLYLPKHLSKKISLVYLSYNFPEKIYYLKKGVRVELYTSTESINTQINKIISRLNLSKADSNLETVYQKIKSFLVFDQNKDDFFYSLSKEQDEILKNDSVKRRRISGAAGSGKTLLVAFKAARLLLQGKSVLVTSFNITIMNYVRALIIKGLTNPEKLGLHGSQIKILENYSDNLESVHFHGKLKQWANEVGYNGYITADNCPDEVLEKLKKDNNLLQSLKYDAIIIDEGQDFKSSWFKLLSELVKDNGYLLLFADATQDLYSCSASLKENESKGLGFKGPWKKLEVSYRLPENIATLSKDFAQNFINTDPELVDVTVLPQYKVTKKQTNLFGTSIDAFQFNLVSNKTSETHDCIIILKIKNVLSSLLNNYGISLGDITLLCTDKSLGRKIVKALNEDNILTESVFEDGKINRYEKLNMGTHRDYLKCSTVHSFKGWEANTIIFVNAYGRKDNSEDIKTIRASDHNRFYVALTRLSENINGSKLIIINEFKEYEQFLKDEFNSNDFGKFYDLSLCEHTKKAKVILYEEKI